jgi:hypothetical protein
MFFSRSSSFGALLFSSEESWGVLEEDLSSSFFVEEELASSFVDDEDLEPSSLSKRNLHRFSLMTKTLRQFFLTMMIWLCLFLKTKILLRPWRTNCPGIQKILR